MADRDGVAPSLFRNPVSLLGGIIIVISLANIVFLFLVDAISGVANPYLGMITYMVLPGVLIGGIVILLFGAWRESHRRRTSAAGEMPAYPRIDLNIPSHRNAVLAIGSFALVFVTLSAVGSYRAYEFTDSVQFCGQLCHSVMNPEFTAYLKSPHARVACVDCHVGPGAGWYVKSKLSGAYQVYATTLNKYPKPIPTPVANLRPAQQTCEQCHWPEKFYGAQLKTINHYKYDEQNTLEQIRLLIKTGGGSPTTGATTGIHWHMNIANKVTYVSSDKQRQVIPWVRIEDRDGNVTEYTAKDANLKPQDLAKLPSRRMDCVDCHSRPSHIYVPPDRAVDELIAAGKVDPSLPFLKQNAVTVLSKEYPDTVKAKDTIAAELISTYRTKYPETFNQNQAQIKQAVAEVQRVYETNYFPEMKIDWKTHPNNIGHFYYPGCFRCHDGQHVSKDGKVISRDCNVCHTILDQSEGKVQQAMAGGVFKHPGGEMDFSSTNCNDCHTGGPQ